MLEVGNYVTLSDGIEDDDLEEFMQENFGDFEDRPRVKVTEVEDENFWGVTENGVNIPYHMELKDVLYISEK